MKLNILEIATTLTGSQPLNDFIKNLRKVYEGIPVERRDEAYVKIGASYLPSDDEHEGKVEICYYREETDKEYKKRTNSAELQALRKLEVERREYERLKEKFEGSRLRRELTENWRKAKHNEARGLAS